MNWNEFWPDADDAEREHASPGASFVGDLVEPLVTEFDPGSVADVGCGAGAVAFGIATRFPDLTVVGYDAAESILAENRERARVEGLSNVSFERTVLPAFQPDRQFDLVCCIATLHYVPEVERALEGLYDAVAPDGALVVHYANEHGRAHYRSTAATPEAVLGDRSGVDPERFADRYRALLDGESTLSYDRIHDVLGRWPRSVKSTVDLPDDRWAWRHEPIVWIPK